MVKLAQLRRELRVTARRVRDLELTLGDLRRRGSPAARIAEELLYAAKALFAAYSDELRFLSREAELLGRHVG